MINVRSTSTHEPWLSVRSNPIRQPQNSPYKNSTVLGVPIWGKLTMARYPWLSATLWYLHCISSGDTTVLHEAINMHKNTSTVTSVINRIFQTWDVDINEFMLIGNLLHCFSLHISQYKAYQGKNRIHSIGYDKTHLRRYFQYDHVWNLKYTFCVRSQWITMITNFQKLQLTNSRKLQLSWL